MIEVPSCHEFTNTSKDYSEEDLSNSTIQSWVQDIFSSTPIKSSLLETIYGIFLAGYHDLF